MKVPEEIDFVPDVVTDPLEEIGQEERGHETNGRRPGSGQIDSQEPDVAGQGRIETAQPERKGKRPEGQAVKEEPDEETEPEGSPQ